MPSDQPPAYAPKDLTAYTEALFRAVGAEDDKAATVARLLVAADAMGHTTHGLQLCAPYLKELEAGNMLGRGAPEVVSDRGAALVWDGRRLPGVWLTAEALDTALGRVAEHGVVSVAIRRSHHIGCLAVYLARAVEQGCMILLTCSDPAAASVAPFGGVEAVFTPDPFAIGIPTDGAPILIDTSASISTNGMASRLHAQGGRFPGRWAMDAQGVATDDPAVLFADPPGTLLPTGGIDHGHKGYALALLVEALSQGLSGHGRADPTEGWGASVFLQVIDPEAFGGGAGFRRQTGWLAAACRASAPAPGVEAVRLPGERALQRRQAAEAEGLRLHPGILDSLSPWGERFGVSPPAPLG